MNEPFIIQHRFCIVCVTAAILAAGNIGQYLYFTGRIGANAAGYAKRERELEAGYASLERELVGERNRRREALGLVGGLEAAVSRTGGGITAALGLVAKIREELAELAACLSD
jgi:hypothetical protein